MTRLLTIIWVVLVLAYSAAAQDVCISQDAANKCASAARELIEARNVIAEGA